MKLKIISFNIRCCDDKHGNSIAERAPRLNSVISPFDADVIGLQECRPQWEPYINKYFSDKYEIFNKYRSKEIDVESSPILWKKDHFDCLKTGYFWLSDTPEVESRGWDEVCECYRMCVYAVLRNKHSNVTFTFMNTHLGFGDTCQKKSVELIHDRSLSISSNPTVIVGDFNMTPDSIGYASMIKHFTDVNTITENDLRSTYHGYHPEKITNEHIDYCFVDGNITPLSQKIIDDKVDGKFPSDHYGLYVTVNI